MDPHRFPLKIGRVLSPPFGGAPLRVAVRVLALGAALYVITYPFTVVHYPPITDLPYHAAMMSIFRHYLDSGWHFREQFVLEPWTARFWTFQVLGALFAGVLPIVPAAKLACIVMLALLPGGLALLAWGMRKSPLLGVLALPLVWNTMTHWGFLNYIGAIGLFAAVLGLTLLTLDRPARARQIALTAALLATLGTHAFRMPMALAAVLGTTLVMWPATRRFRPVLGPFLVASLATFTWFVVNREFIVDRVSRKGLTLDPARLRTLLDSLFKGFYGPAEQALARRSLWILGVVVLLCALGFMLEKRWRRWSKGDRRWAVGTALTGFGAVGACLLAYVTLPMRVDEFAWYIYPREAVAAVLLALALTPDLPRSWLLRLLLVAAVAWGSAAQMRYVARDWRQFEKVSSDFRVVSRELPQAPRLGYMVFDHSGSNRLDSPFLHLPNWIQAEKGGWLSWHCASFTLMPVRYRPGFAAVPPPTPEAFEWRPELFDVTTRGRFFDWFLVRSEPSPDWLFAADPGIRLVRTEGRWWLFHREAAR